MQTQEYENWWKLHLRTVMGESLPDEENAQYQSGLQNLYSEENLEGSVDTLQQTRHKVQELQNTYHLLRERYEILEQEIVQLEAKMSESTRTLLSMNN